MSEKRICPKSDQEFVIDKADKLYYEKIGVPLPKLCPEERFKRRAAWRNERNLYKRTCDGTGETIFATIAPDKPYTVYSPEYWVSDNWDALDYGREYDWDRPFFEQFGDLRKVVPYRALFVIPGSSVNSPYTNLVSYLKNCYLLFNSDYNEECYYGTEIQHSRQCIDCKLMESCELMYESVNCQKCYQTFFSIDCEDSHDLWFSKNCSGCSHCFGCVNLRKQSYCIFNEQYSKEDYEAKLAEFNLGSYENLQNLQSQINDFFVQHPVKYMHGKQNIDVTGDYIYNSKNVHDSYMVYESQNCRYCWMLVVAPAKDCYDYSEYGDNAELVYESITCGLGVSNLKFCSHCLKNSRNLEYCMDCINCEDCFGCIALKSKQFCIFNQQYTESEYHDLVTKIKAHMNQMPYVDAAGFAHAYGEFFPAELSAYAYNESTAYEYFPDDQAAVESQGYHWREPEPSAHTVTMSAADLPDSITDTPDSIINEVIGCAETGRAYRIVQSEYEFCQQFGIPLPRLHPEVRFQKRFDRMNPFKLWQRTTDDGEKVMTSYAPDRPERILSEQAYQQEIL